MSDEIESDGPREMLAEHSTVVIADIHADMDCEHLHLHTSSCTSAHSILSLKPKMLLKETRRDIDDIENIPDNISWKIISKNLDSYIIKNDYNDKLILPELLECSTIKSMDNTQRKKRERTFLWNERKKRVWDTDRRKISKSGSDCENMDAIEHSTWCQDKKMKQSILSEANKCDGFDVIKSSALYLKGQLLTPKPTFPRRQYASYTKHWKSPPKADDVENATSSSGNDCSLRSRKYLCYYN
ncbi:uncharacterized protein LOC129573473 [Sitodiplosis mosellana]|uniref:uncharacterized protein LOC129573473 n=1 Tax=Sitodiplosis mosellana TaxID=263140 RepID=UPI002444FBFA|nr:uncharacterized protein LOC129573473 [Sitodiplosis mosellana]